MEEKIQQIREETRRLRKEIRGRTVGYIMAGLGFVVGLAWNDAIKSFIEYVFPLEKNSLLAKFTYAGIVTILLVVAAGYIFRPEPEEGKK
jgi:hypothetical protein